MRAARRANPLVGWNPHLLPELRDQLRKARQSDDGFARWCSYRLNRPMQPARTVLFTVAAWRRIEARPVPDAVGRPIAGVDVGSSRAWTYRLPAVAERAAPTSAWWRPANPGPVRTGETRRDAGRRLPPSAWMTACYRGRRGPARRSAGAADRPARRISARALIVGDEFRRPAVADAIGGRAPWATRRTRWSEITEDIGHCRKLGHDGGLAVTPESRRALTMAFSETEIEGDDDGNVRLTKRRRGRSRDDLCVALVMAAGALARTPSRPRRVYHGTV